MQTLVRNDIKSKFLPERLRGADSDQLHRVESMLDGMQSYRVKQASAG